jgi:hypothetical protein
MRSERARNFRTRLCRICAEIVTPRHHASVTLRAKLAAAAVAALLAPAASAALPTSGLYGVVTKGPIVPVCHVGTPCDAPVQVTLVFSRLGRDVARTRSTAAGRYRIALTPGYYAVRTLERIGITRNIRPVNVHVRRGHVDRLDFAIDTGIR